MAEAFIYKAPQPYPTLATGGLRSDPFKVRLLMELYSGAKSEMTAIQQYNYQSFILREPRQARVQCALEHISHVEMTHLTMLAGLICLYGGDPRYIRPTQRQFWSASAVNYTQDICELLLCDLKGEVAAVDAYLNTAKQICDTYAAAVLKRIAQDELCHIEVLKQLISECRCRPCLK